MRVATVDGLVTLFYDGLKEPHNRELHDEWIRGYDDRDLEDWEEWNLSDECKEHYRERFSWQQVIIEEGITVIPDSTFSYCRNIKRVIFSDSVIRIGHWAFAFCSSIISIKLPINLESVGQYAFCTCDLVNVFIPPRCREINYAAFCTNKNLTIFNVPKQTEIGDYFVIHTKLLRNSPFNKQPCDDDDYCDLYDYDWNDVHNWIRNINNDEEYTLHRACSSFQPLDEIIHSIIEARGIGAFAKKNEMGITPSQYLSENPYVDIKEMDVIREYVMKMMG